MTGVKGGGQASGLHHGVGCEQATLGQLGAEGAEGADFFFGSDTGDDVAGEAAHDVGAGPVYLQAADHVANDRGERVAVVERERGHFVAQTTKVHGLFERHRLRVAAVPELLRFGVAVGRWLVQCVLCLAQGCILQGDKIPGVGCQPRSVLRHRGRLFLAGLDGLKFFDTGAFEEALSGLAVNRFGDKAILDFQRICQHPLERGIF